MFSRFWLLLCSCGLLLFLAACGDIPVSSPTTPAGGSTNGNGSLTNSSPATKTKGPVSIETNHSAYGATEPIKVTVVNTSSAAIYALDGKANCSIVSLEYQDKGVWKESSTAACTSGKAGALVTIDPGTSSTMTIQVPPNRALVSGIYRVVLRYSTTKQGTDLSSHVTTQPSQTFTVGSTLGL